MGGADVSAVALDIQAVRARFPALRSGVAYFDGPGGTQVPQDVVDAIARYLRESNANLGGAFAASRRSDELVAEARAAAAAFVGATAGEILFGANMTSLNFALSRTVGRELGEGDEILVTRLDHDGNVSPWLELARDRGLVVRFADIRDDTGLDVEDAERQISARTRIVAFPWASNAVGTLVDVERVAALARDAGALAWVDAVHYAPHGPIDVEAAGVDVLVWSPYKVYGPHLGVAFARAGLLKRWRPYKVRPAPDTPLGYRHETGTLAHELLAGLVAALEYVDELGLEAIVAHERALGQRLLEGLPSNCRLVGLPTMDGRVPTFAFTVEGRTPADVAMRLADDDIAVWHGNYYAVEVMRRLGLDPDGAVRAGIVHYNDANDVDRLLEALRRL